MIFIIIVFPWHIMFLLARLSNNKNFVVKKHREFVTILTRVNSHKLSSLSCSMFISRNNQTCFTAQLRHFTDYRVYFRSERQQHWTTGQHWSNGASNIKPVLIFTMTLWPAMVRVAYTSGVYIIAYLCTSYHHQWRVYTCDAARTSTEHHHVWSLS